MTVDVDEDVHAALARVRAARAAAVAQHLMANRFKPHPAAPAQAPAGEPDLAALQRSASERAAKLWDPNELAEMLPGGLRAMDEAVTGALGALADTGPNKTPFLGEAYLRDYHRSPHWRAVRERALLRAGGYCSRCKRHYADRQLEVHHLTYRNVGQERESELIVLCHQCHEIEHGKSW